MDFKDKVVWITGASSGIGEHLAYAFAEHGAHLVLSSRDPQELERVRRNCPAGAHVRVLPLDVTAFDKLPALAGEVVSEFGYISLLINNAGLSQRSGALEADFSVDRRLMDVNFLGPVALTKAVLPAMVRQQFGHIVVVSSILGKVAVPQRSAYCASKHALHGFFDSLRAEVSPENIKVTILCPGYVHTNLPINALRGDGSPNSRPDADRQGMEPAFFAQKALQAIAEEKNEAYIAGPRELLAVYAGRLFPKLFQRVVRGMGK